MPQKNAFREESILKTLPSEVNYNEEAKKMGFDGDGETIKIAIISSGVPDHPSINSSGKNICFSDSQTLADTFGQSTIVSGIIAANDPKNIVGIAPKAQLIFSKITNDDGKISVESVISSILWAIIRRVDIIVLPMTTDADVITLNDAVQKAHNANIAFVCAAGNGELRFPASYDNVLSVGALRTSGEIAEFSSNGRVNAIGSAVISTHLNGNFVIASGGACATAFVSGLLALLIASKEGTTPMDELYKEIAEKLAHKE